ncbi:MAG: Arylsulfatase A [Verrucomicrobia bacterium]|nr:MAG: Arylsulfatase A [Verrucomicrobiota bacterium]
MRLFAALLALLFAPLLAADPAKPASRPNILHIHADDHRPDGLHALGSPHLQTPNLDALVARGMTFRRCYTMGSMIGAVCTPSRTMMLTGRSWQRIPGAPGAMANAGDRNTFLPSVIAEAGYETWTMGKPGNAFTAGIRAFQTCIEDAAMGTGPENDRVHACQRLADRTISFLESREARRDARPFYIYLAPPVPHDPRSTEARFHDLYDPNEMPLSPAFLPQHPFDNGEMTVRDEWLAPWPRTPQDTKRQIAEVSACITALDHHVGRIFAALKTAGDWENTLVIFSADNGISLGEHGLFGKQNLYEFGGMHVPLVIAGPGIPNGRSEALVYLMDLFPTLADYAGAKLPDGIEGRSLRPVIEGKSPGLRDALYTGYRDCMRAIRDDRWKLIRYPIVDQTQLFDLAADPLELNNLAPHPAQAAKLAELTARLEREMMAHGDSHPLKVPNPKSPEWHPPSLGDFRHLVRAETWTEAWPAPSGAMETRTVTAEIWTEAMQAALDRWKTLHIPARDQPYYLDGPLVLKSGAKLTADPTAEIRLKPGTNTCMLRNEHIVGFADKPVPDSLRPDANLTIEGGIWTTLATARAEFNGNARGNSSKKNPVPGTHGVVLLHNVRNVTVRNVAIRQSKAFAVHLGNIRDFTVDGLTLDRHGRDGVHIDGPASEGIIRNVSGDSHDDPVSLTAWDWKQYSASFGPIHHLIIERITGAPEEKQGTDAIRLLPGVKQFSDGSRLDCPIHDITLREITDIRDFKLYDQPNLELGRTNDFSHSIGTLRNILFEKLTFNRPGHIQVHAHTDGLTVRDVKLLFPLPADYHLLELGPKSMTYQGAPGTDPSRWTEIFSPDLDCTVRNVSVADVRTRDSDSALPIDQLVKVIELTPNPDYPKTTPKGGTGRGIWVR